MHSYPKNPALKTPDDIKNKNVTIMGLGLNGGGEAAVRFFSRYGANITVTDLKTEAELMPTLDALESDPAVNTQKIRFVLGRHEMQDFSDADIVIKNPGAKYEGNKYLAAAKTIETDISLFLQFTKAPVIAVTGSKGKSSTVSAIQHGLSRLGITSFLGGNITVSPLSFLEKTTEQTPVVLELSSWQLGDLRGRGILKPYIAVITTIVPDHQNWYGNMESYVADKKLIYAEQTSSCWTICDYSCPWGHIFAEETNASVAWCSGSPFDFEKQENCAAWLDNNGIGWVLHPHRNKLQPPASLFENKSYCFSAEKNFREQPKPQCILDTISAPGFHTKKNVLNASLALYLLGIPAASIKTAMETYQGIPHRLEFFYEWQCGNISALFYNDSAATVPEAAEAAIKSFPEKIIAICGGTDKNLDFSALAETAKQTERLYLLAGSGTDKLLPLLNKNRAAYNGPYKTLEELLASLKNDLNAASEHTGSKKTERIVFTPGATSFGMFRNEFDRGDTYKQTVKRIFC
ncbi:MAG: UDP-N-acetylmuramoyl-L-alanine--D-glutamate ligase [Bacteroides sp.]|nr:UDP-N-acetylmuramoyl-L-alanine--D-glutamate ligase [Prevotella sp.]MCM1408760.1 UDP-N-acetylmuramoyl-L-alanine--D-glutamate ligase [Treponema brennaborense]MCM1470675.1 UDP-N-acetylmuramoyl-L-alanine--D-glutamate ligase [Bacteroides sp.]